MVSPETSPSPARSTADAVEALLRCPGLLEESFVDELLLLVGTEFARPLLEAARAQWRERQALDGGALLALAPNERARVSLSERLVRVDEASTESSKQTVRDCVARQLDVFDRKKQRTLRAEIARADASGNTARADELQREAHELATTRQRRVSAQRTDARL